MIVTIIYNYLKGHFLTYCALILGNQGSILKLDILSVHQRVITL